MIIIKKLFLIVFCVAFFIFLSACNLKTQPQFSEVDINQKLPVQIQYRQNLYLGEVKFNGGEMLLKLKGNNSAVDGVAFCVTPDDCILTYGDISKSLSSCDNDFLPRIIYDFFISFGGNVVFNGVNEGKSTQYITRNVNGYSVSLITDIEGITNEYKILIKS